MKVEAALPLGMNRGDMRPLASMPGGNPDLPKDPLKPTEKGEKTPVEPPPPEAAQKEVDEKQVIAAIEQANRWIINRETYLKFSIHEGTHKIIVKVMDARNDEVIREIPPEKLMDMVAKLWELAGLIIDEKV